MSNVTACMNTDRELWRAPDLTGHGEAYSDSIHVTEGGGIGINIGGNVVVLSLRDWHALATGTAKIINAALGPRQEEARDKLIETLEGEIARLDSVLSDIAQIANADSFGGMVAIRDLLRGRTSALKSSERPGRKKIAQIIAKELGQEFDDLIDFHFQPDDFCQDDFLRAADAVLAALSSPPPPAQGGEIDEAALEAATKRIYEDKGDRKGVMYVGWDDEPESVKEQWREDVRVSIEAYLAAAVRSPAAKFGGDENGYEVIVGLQSLRDAKAGNAIRYINQLRDRLTQAERQVEGGAWRDISTAPKDGSWIVAICNDHSEVFHVFWLADQEMWYGHRGAYGDGLFAPKGGWIPAPAPKPRTLSITSTNQTTAGE